MNCPKCGHAFPNPVCQAGGYVGGSTPCKSPKGFAANRFALRLAIDVRRRNAAERKAAAAEGSAQAGDAAGKTAGA